MNENIMLFMKIVISTTVKISLYSRSHKSISNAVHCIHHCYTIITDCVKYIVRKNSIKA